MALRSPIARRLPRSAAASAMLSFGLLATGCVVEPARDPRASVALPPAQPQVTTEYTPASQIRPSDSAVAPAPMPAVPDAPKAVPSRRTHVAGNWTPPVKARAWRYIVIHHSATEAGNAAAFDREHREKGWDELGYHFVIGNGSRSGDGQVEVGPRWTKQKYGAHAKTADERYNNFGIGICLVGNMDTARPTAQQQEAMARLVAWLMETYDVPASCVVGHRDTKSTACPGRYTNVVALRARAAQMIADAGGTVPHDPVAAAGGELIQAR